MNGDVFDHDDRVGALGDRGAGHNFHGLAGADGAGEYFAGANLADHAQAAGQVGGSNGKAVADGAVEGRIIAIGGNVLGEDAIGSRFERYVFNGRRGCVRAQLAEDAGAR
jgi:hypothetical protein